MENPETGGTFFAKDVKSTHNYQPLREGEIRLLTVFPGEPTDPLRDVICINQLDEITEKPSQIRLGRIFQEASCTLAFLGADQESSCAIETLMQISAKGIYGTCEKHWPKGLPACASLWSEMNIPQAEDPLLQQIVASFQRPWFRRTWVVQEAIAAPVVKVVCGKWIIDWDELFLAIEHVEQDIKSIPKVDRTAWQPFLTLARHREWEARHTRWSLIRMLETLRHVASGRMRDRFFALLGLAADGDRDEFEPDYQSDFEVIVSRLAEAFVRDGHGIELLTRAGLNPQSDRFPSWILDWTVPRHISLSDSFDRGGVYNASGDSEGEFFVTKEQDFHEICV
ncbi:uncharacterized protein Z519_12665 [Cladophialophora bantiana CBS 173.52]|uniref:Heterokaryon incompatibility domain-containing protein n=1 Tax=Cladophialophora bantiana (strain ATCC 10958 / CBS 173.52 / CDC B-1940 / NIH 8579) TaxID=1442370 RepID=A0A0D2FJ72_CLAB1|nr:uncharacterized protein Z519_12665 [Cladophialophora bantiana CBS 173.52]KIW86752.1 hypothetical protein Z519_12665 [Cladophialophora bantiana CBS 173.52]